MTFEPDSNKICIEYILSFAFATGIMLSSDMLVIFGNFLGHTGFVGFFLIAIIAAIYTIFLSQYRYFFDQAPKPASDFDTLERHTESILTLFPIFVKLIAVLFLATGLLVSSGFVFNEIFLYWFPNFGFAYLLLFFLLILQLFPNRIILNFQLGFIGILIIGLLILIIAGLYKPVDLVLALKVDVLTTMSTKIDIWFTPFLFFIGFDMAFSIRDRSNQPIKKSYLKVAFALFFMALFFIFWGVVTIKHVPLQKLSNSTIPHIITAKYIWGDVGKMVMGTIVIAGSLAAIHCLFTTIRIQSSQFLHLKKNTMIPKVIIMVLGTIIGGLMAIGLAGYEILEIFIMGVFILWLLSYTFISAWSMIKQKFSLFRSIINATVFLLLLISVIILIYTNKEPIILMIFIGMAMCTTFPISILYIKRNRHHQKFIKKERLR